MRFVDMAAIFTIAVLAGTGVGGGGLPVIYLTGVLSLGQSDAQALSLLFFIAAAAAALPYHMKHRKINLKLTAAFAVLGIIGALFGNLLRMTLSESSIRHIFGYFLLITGLFSLLRKKLGNVRIRRK